MHYVARTLDYSIVFPPKRRKPGVVGAHDLLNPLPLPPICLQPTSNICIYVCQYISFFPPPPKKNLSYILKATQHHTRTHNTRIKKQKNWRFIQIFKKNVKREKL